MCAIFYDGWHSCGHHLYQSFKVDVRRYIVDYLLLLGAAVSKLFCRKQIKASETLNLNILMLMILRGQLLCPEA